MSDFRVWLVSILKGGARKTTTAMLTAFALADREEILVVDADTGTQGVTDWAGIYFREHPAGELPFHVAQYGNRDGLLVPFIRDQVRRTGASLVIIDTGAEDPAILKQAAGMARLIIVPTGPDQAEYGRVAPTMTEINTVARDVRRVMLLTRVPQLGRGVAIAVREALDHDGYDVLRAEVPHHRERYEQVYGTIPADVGAYGAVADELLAIDRAEVAA